MFICILLPSATLRLKLYIADIRAQVETIRYEANQFKFNNGFPIPVHVLAKRMADLAQVCPHKTLWSDILT